MGEWAEENGFAAMKRRRQERGQRNREQAGRDFWNAQQLATDHDLGLVQNSETHYQLIGDDWVINLYPGNQRIYRDPGHRRGPQLNIDKRGPWTLIDCVEAAIKELNLEPNP